MLGDPEGEFEIAQLGVGRRTFGYNLQRHVVDHGIVAALHQQASGDGLCGQPGGAGIGQRARQQQPQIPLGGDNGDGLVRGIGRYDHFGEDFGDGAGGFSIERPVERDDAAKGGSRIARQRLAVGADEIGAFRDAAGVGMLDDDAGRGARRIELADAFIGRVGVVDIVV
ncbi:hypothetical protein GALL_529680 [mine drainage metagenome]|uniref:Uncharacterized protein n=1 Tax=mine drainage metagenome TaxID=410659 RepID=A0A1J5P449_9ZZZZ